jgi:hypothetical protein
LQCFEVFCIGAFLHSFPTPCVFQVVLVHLISADVSMIQDGLDVRWHALLADQDRLDGLVYFLHPSVHRRERLWEAEVLVHQANRIWDDLG